MLFSIGILISLAIQIFCLVTLASYECTPVTEQKRSIFKWFITTIIIKHFFQISIGSIIEFENTELMCIEALIIVYDQCMFIINLKLSADLVFLSCPPSYHNKTIFSLINEMLIVMIATFSNVVYRDTSYLIVFMTSSTSTILSFAFCSLEISILLMLYTVSFLLRLWMNEAVLIYYQTVLWFFIVVWFSFDKRRNHDTYSPTVRDEQAFETIELT